MSVCPMTTPGDKLDCVHSMDGETETLGILDRVGSQLGSFPAEKPEGRLPGAQDLSQNLLGSFS